MRQHRNQLATGQRRQPCLALLRRTQLHDGLRSYYGAGEEWFQQQALAYRIAYQHGANRACANAALFFWNVDRQQAQFAQLQPDVTRPAILRRQYAVAMLEAVALADETTRGVQQHLLFFVE